LCINYALNFSQNSGNTTVLVGSSAYWWKWASKLLPSTNIIQK
jgi:hypothetical protein